MESLLFFEEASFKVLIGTVIVGVLIMFFIISPVMGWMMARGIARRLTLVIVATSMLMVGSFAFASVGYFLREHYNETQLAQVPLIVISTALALLMALVAGLVTAWAIAPPPSALVLEQQSLENAEDPDGLIFAERRQERLKKQHKQR